MRVGLAIVLSLAAAPFAQAAFDCAAPANAPRCVDVAIPVPDGLTVPENHVRVFLPTGYTDSTASYPVLYLLHGAGDTYKTWSENTDAFNFTAGKNVIVVMPDGGKNSEAGWYSDWLDGSRQWETFHTGILVRYIDNNYRTLGDGHRAVAGLSMGGFGATHYAAHHPGLFQAVATLSGAVDINLGFPATGVAFTLFHQQFGTPTDGTWGNQLTEQTNWRANNPTDLTWYFKSVKLLLIATGNGEPGGKYDDPSNPGGYFLEAGIAQMNDSFVRALDAAGIVHVDNFYGPGQHSWPYWQDDLHWALPQMLPVIQ